MSGPTFVPCRICGRPVRLHPSMLIWGRPMCRECQDGPDPDEPGILDQHFEREALGEETP